MKLQNNTPIPDPVIRAVLTAARTEARARSRGVVVQVNRGHTCVSGTAYDAGWIWWGRGRRKVRCNGAIRLSFPVEDARDALDVAERVYRIAAHEWRHIRDYDTPGLAWDWERPQRGRRRANHSDRPQERRARSTQRQAQENIERHADAVLALALAIEEARK